VIYREASMEKNICLKTSSIPHISFEKENEACALSQSFATPTKKTFR